jgi:hypothetical protein
MPSAPIVGRGIEKAPDIRVKHPVHTSPQNAGVQSVQRIVLAASRPEPIGEANEVLLVDCLDGHTYSFAISIEPQFYDPIEGRLAMTNEPHLRDRVQ